MLADQSSIDNVPASQLAGSYGTGETQITNFRKMARGYKGMSISQFGLNQDLIQIPHQLLNLTQAVFSQFHIL